jgi:hypothetical protein
MSTDKSVWLTRSEVEELCPDCGKEMSDKGISKIKIMNSDGELLDALKAGFSQGLCDKFGGASGFRTRCMSAMEGKDISDVGAFCNSLKIHCHGSAGAEGKRARVIEKDATQRYTLGIVYEPDELDTDEEFAKAEDIEHAAWNFMRYLQGRQEAALAAFEALAEIAESAKRGEEVQIEMDDEAMESFIKRGVNAMHIEDLEHSEIVESWIAPVDMRIGKESIKKGSWLMGIVWDEEAYKKVESGEWTGYSMGGWAKKVNGDG